MANKKTQQSSQDVEQKLGVSEAFIEKYKKPVLYGLVAIIVVIVGIFAYINYVVEPREAKANDLIFKGQEYFAADEYEKAVNGDEQGYPGFLEIASDYSSTKAGNLAALYTGLSYAKLGNYEEAVKFLEKYSNCDDAMISPAALGALGNCYAELGNLEKAAKTLLEAAEEADNNSLSPLYLIQAGEIFEKLGKNEDALECYELIKEEYVNSMQYNDIDKYIERVSK